VRTQLFAWSVALSLPGRGASIGESGDTSQPGTQDADAIRGVTCAANLLVIHWTSETPIDGGMLLLEQFAFRFSERLVNEMTSSTIEQDCLVEIVSDNAKRD
jgi:hypothetical protein